MDPMYFLAALSMGYLVMVRRALRADPGRGLRISPRSVS
jgi:hypothetical protein